MAPGPLSARPMGSGAQTPSQGKAPYLPDRQPGQRRLGSVSDSELPAAAAVRPPAGHPGYVPELSGAASGPPAPSPPASGPGFPDTHQLDIGKLSGVGAAGGVGKGGFPIHPDGQG